MRNLKDLKIYRMSKFIDHFHNFLTQQFIPLKEPAMNLNALSGKMLSVNHIHVEVGIKIGYESIGPFSCARNHENDLLKKKFI